MRPTAEQMGRMNWAVRPSATNRTERDQPWSDHPDCASPVIGAFLRTWNDSLPDADRQTLKQYIPRLVGSKGTTAQEDHRAWMALDWLVRVHTPAWLRLAGMVDQANLLAGLDVVSVETYVSIEPTLRAVRRYAVTTSSAVVDEVVDAASDAAVSAAAPAALNAASSAGVPAARNAATVAALDAACFATVSAGESPSALQPTVIELQASAHDLIDRMFAVTEAAA